MPVRDEPVSDIVEAFEASAAADPTADVADFAPPPGSPSRAAALAELIRVDLERRWRAGTPERLSAYLRRFPEAFAAPFVGGLAFEEYRQRCHAGEQVSPSEYRDRYGIDVAEWPVIPAGSLAQRYQSRVVPPAPSTSWPVSSGPSIPPSLDRP
jgi:hypothetical protein